jgi:sporulation protein YlmC with PRC-barrel domain
MDGVLIDIRPNTLVECADGSWGKCVQVIVNPATGQMTHLVVEEKREPHAQRLVPIDMVAEAMPHLIRLRCTVDQLAAMEEFIEDQVVRITTPPAPYMSAGADYGMWLSTFPFTQEVHIPHERVPAGEVGLHRGARVHAIDGSVGQVDELLMQPPDGRITHLVLREGHLWGKKDVLIPVEKIKRIEADTVYLKLSKRQIESLPAVPGKIEKQ